MIDDAIKDREKNPEGRPKPPRRKEAPPEPVAEPDPSHSDHDRADQLAELYPAFDLQVTRRRADRTRRVTESVFGEQAPLGHRAGRAGGAPEAAGRAR